MVFPTANVMLGSAPVFAPRPHVLRSAAALGMPLSHPANDNLQQSIRIYPFPASAGARGSRGKQEVTCMVRYSVPSEAILCTHPWLWLSEQRKYACHRRIQEGRPK